MRHVRQRLGVLLVLAAVAVPLAFASLAWACGVLATLHLTPSATNVGTAISGFGGNYSPSPKASPVSLHFNSRTGPILWTGRPDSNGTIHPSFPTPGVPAGYYVVNAMQTSPFGAPQPGTPGRAVLRIGNPKKLRGGLAAWPSATGTSSGGVGSSAPSGFTLTSGTLVAALSAALLASGAGLLLGDRRRTHRSAAVV